MSGASSRNDSRSSRSALTTSVAGSADGCVASVRYDAFYAYFGADRDSSRSARGSIF